MFAECPLCDGCFASSMLKSTNTGVGRVSVQISAQPRTGADGNLREFFTISESLLPSLTVGMSALKVVETIEHATGP